MQMAAFFFNGKKKHIVLPTAALRLRKILGPKILLGCGIDWFYLESLLLSLFIFSAVSIEFSITR